MKRRAKNLPVSILLPLCRDRKPPAVTNSNKSDLVLFEYDRQMVCPITIRVNIYIRVRFVQVWIG